MLKLDERVCVIVVLGSGRDTVTEADKLAPQPALGRSRAN
jgi:hypothetical protein